eukprot:543202_1
MSDNVLQTCLCGNPFGFVSHLNTQFQRQFDLTEKKERELGCEYLLSLVEIPEFDMTQISYYGNECMSDSTMQRCMYHIVSFEFVNNEERTCSVMMGLTAKFKHVHKAEKRYKMLGNLYRIIRILTHNPLMMKYLFNLNKCKFSNIIIKSLIDGLISNIPTFYKQIKAHGLKICDQWTACSYILSNTIKYWKSVNCVFAIENGLCKLISSLYRFAIDINYKYQHISASIFMTFSMNVYNLFKHHIEKMDRKNNLILVTILKREFGGNTCDYFTKRFINDAANFSSVPNKKHYLPVKCEWIQCSKQKHEFGIKNICSGCGLVQYCSRNHQKKHWKFIHYQQCSKRYYKI